MHGFAHCRTSSTATGHHCTCCGFFVTCISEAYDLDPKGNTEGRAILAEIMSVAEEYRDKVTIILAGYQDDIEQQLLAFNPGLASRFEVRVAGPSLPSVRTSHARPCCNTVVR